MRKCTCDICKISKEIQRITEQYKLSQEDSWLLNDTFWARLEAAETDRDYLQAILDGNWHNSVERLEFALAKAKSIKEK